MVFLLLLAAVGGAVERSLFLLSIAGDGEAAERILLLRADLGQLSFLDLLCEFCWVLRFVVGRILCSSGLSSSVGMTADFTPMFTALEFLGLFVFFFAAVAGWFFVVLHAHLWISGLGEEGGGEGKVEELTAVFKYHEWFAAFQWLELAPCFGLGRFCGLNSSGVTQRPAELRLIDHTRKMMNSGDWDLVVILLLLRVLYAKKDCTVLDI